jgi:hypothetical protein
MIVEKMKKRLICFSKIKKEGIWDFYHVLSMALDIGATRKNGVQNAIRSIAIVIWKFQVIFIDRGLYV